ncbi:hypothetical protein [Leeuwenhoekiella marinoflava]|uniref:Uncharacterized protein n=2 Tax=Leeuwenhoekiella marinoflava TaxID=988 RepID=A0A4Q0PG25_9FLAO|nr:hypothetical protein [Leeuwenhoekiella marinoflava]RXG25940.1 hypothetical protein DSL99_3345 [Leeuwenhoekiella marinoflava]SHF73676.1 hypothetical protein SAMN02745246_03271 [Leeuwenhoekiella marinoflava DSM 3653]
MQKLFSLLVLGLLLIQCKKANPENTDTEQSQIPIEQNQGIGGGAPSLEDAVSQTIATAHQNDAFLSKETIRFNINLDFGGVNRLDAKVTLLTNSSKIRIDKTDGSSLIYDGESVYLTPKEANSANARFDIFTWAYFFAFPYKLADPGTHLTPLETPELDGSQYESFKLTFESGTGDSPDDWYVGYLNNDHTIHAAGYIVTFGNKPIEKAESSPHAIVYSNYKEINGIPIATTWDFYNWSQSAGLFGEPIGHAILSNLKFTKASDSSFTKPASFLEIE